MTTYSHALAANIRAARARLNVSQDDIGQRMRWLGFGAWIRQTIGSIEQGHREVRADEVFGLAMALETTVVRLMTPVDVAGVQFGNITLSADEAAEAVTGGSEWPLRQPVTAPAGSL